jgi:hypothetical protein
MPVQEPPRTRTEMPVMLGSRRGPGQARHSGSLRADVMGECRSGPDAWVRHFWPGAFGYTTRPVSLETAGDFRWRRLLYAGAPERHFRGVRWVDLA